MALTSTLFTGLSGLDVNQTRLNVVGNNIANVNTVAFKSSRALFKPQFYVTDSGGAPPSDDFGGQNPNQRGLGAVVSSIEKDFTPGAIEPTGKATDLAIDGGGYFVLRSPNSALAAEQRFTRDGSFTLNSSNVLVTAAGDFVQGYGVDVDGNVTQGGVGNITVPLGTATSTKATENVTLQGNLNADGIVAAGASILNSQKLTTVGGLAAPTGATLLTNIAASTASATPLMATGDTFVLQGTKGGRTLADATFEVTSTSTVADLLAFYNEGLGIETSAAPAAGPTPGSTIETDASDPTAARFVIAGNVGEDNALNLSGAAFSSTSGAVPFTFDEGSNAAGFTSNPSGESVNTSFVVYDSLGTSITVDLTAVLESTADTGNVWRFYASSADDTDTELSLGTGTLTFDSDGQLTASEGTTLTIDRNDTGAKTPFAIKLDLDSMSSLTSRDSEMVMTEQDGSPIGSLSSFSIGADGTISGSFSNGLTHTLGQIAVATFANQQGLIDKGGNQYTAGANSGVPVIGTPLSLGAGAVRSGSLELSNVDLSKEFINLIISSTGFSAASRVITTSDQLITELLNSAR